MAANLSEMEPDVTQNMTKSEGEGDQENIFMDNLKGSLDKVIGRCLQSLRFSVFSRHFADINKDNPESLKCIHEHLERELSHAIKTEIDGMFEEENVKGHLDALLMIIKNSQAQSTDHKAWRPSGDPSQDILAHIIPAKKKQKEKLSKVLTDCEKKNEKLVSKVLAARSQLVSLQKEARERTNELAGVNDVNIDAIENYLEKAAFQ